MTNVIVLQEHTPGTPHHSGTPLENSGTPWGVRYTRLTSTALTPFRLILCCASALVVPPMYAIFI